LFHLFTFSSCSTTTTSFLGIIHPLAFVDEFFLTLITGFIINSLKYKTIVAAFIVATNVSSNAEHYAFTQKNHIVITGSSVMTCRHLMINSQRASAAMSQSESINWNISPFDISTAFSIACFFSIDFKWMTFSDGFL
jgi:hypothetical protein